MTTPTLNESVEQAAQWQARLHSDRCTARDRERFAAWLEGDPVHRRAFELVSRIWEMDPRALPDPDGARAGRSRSAAMRDTRRRVVLGAGVLFAGLVIGGRTADARLVSTGFGERKRIETQRFSLLLDARSAVALGPDDTDPDLRTGRFALTVKPGRSAVSLGCGDWRFSSRQGEFDIVSTGTRFSLTTVSGEASVVRKGREAHIVKAGDCLAATLPRGAGVVTRPALDLLLAWRTGRAIFRDTRLDVAVAEMARYSALPVRIENPALSALHVSGVFHTARPGGFFAALPYLLPLRVEQRDGAIRIVKL